MGGREPIIVDALRIPAQLDLLRRVPGFFVVHIYLEAPRRTLEARYATTAKEDAPTYNDALQSDTERNIRQMREHAHLCLETRWLPRRGVAFIARAAIRLTLAVRALRRLVLAFMWGAVPAALLLSTVAWFLADWSTSGSLLLFLRVLMTALFIVMATMIGTVLTPLSPIERDESGTVSPGDAL
jgi:hypothetical protein